MSIWSKLFSNFQWQNRPSTATPLGKINLQKLNDAIDGIDDRVVSLKDDKAETTDVTTALAGKVDKVDGKGLSENDYTTAEKTKLAGISAEANKVEITPVVTEGTTLATIRIDGVDTDIKGSDIDVDSTLSPVSTNPVENKGIFNAISGVLPNITEKTVTGNPISIADGSSVISPKKCEIEFEYTQSGEGDASPSNIKPITAVSGLSLNRDTTQSETPEKTYTATFPYECGSGKYDFASRKLTENFVYIEFDGTEDWLSVGSAPNRFYRLNVSDLVGDSGKCVLSHYKTSAVTTTNTGQNIGYVYNASGIAPRVQIRPNLTDYSDVDAFKTYLAGQYANGTPVQLVYELETAKVTDLGTEELTLLDGTNVLWSSDDISLIYESVGEINIDVDDELSPTSENPVQNKVIYEALNNILPEETAEGNPISITDASGLSAKSCEVTFSPIQSGSGDPSPENIRPINGRDSLVLNQCGKNLFDGTNIVYGYFSTTSITANINARICYIKCEKNKTYTVSKKKGKRFSLATSRVLPTVSASVYQVTDSKYYENESITLTTDSQAEYLLAFVYNSSADSGTAQDMINTVQFEYGNQATTYEPYQGSTNTATFSDTVYGGSYEFVSGEGQSEWGYIASYDGETLPDEWISDRDVYVAGTTPSTGAEVCYKLATPTEITLTAETIELLKGNNVLFTDGDNIELKYSADIKEWVLAQLQS